jgi:hypothetical protein
MTIDKTTLDKLLEGVDPSNPQSMFTDAGLFGQPKKALAERMLQAELTHHLIPSNALLLDRHRLRQIARLIHVRPPRQRRVIRQQLQRHHVQNR